MLSPIREKYTDKEEQIKQVRAEELKREAYLLIGAIKMIVEGDIVIKDGKALDKSGNSLAKNSCLSKKIDEEAKKS